MKTTLFLLVALFINSCQFNCTKGSGNITSEERDFAGARTIELAGSAHVYVSLDSATSLKIEADDNVMPLITTQMQGEKLVIGSKKCYSTKSPVKVYIHVQDLDGVSLTGSGAIEGSSVFTSDVFDISLSGSGTVDFSLKAKSVLADLSGSGRIHLQGETENISVGVAGSGNIDAAKLKSLSVEVSITGSGSASVYATESLDVNITGSGSVLYSGEPAEVKKNITGSGTISKQ